ncbi:MAG: Ig-like domain-containing protein [Ruminococcus sp.]|nr:Ig-like domain-containing protein [Ruminococcus sp.]MDD6710027.1 Ig-like domain-containing protein [Ruminococcus sp.]
MKKRILSIVLSLFLVVYLVPQLAVTSFAATDETLVSTTDNENLKVVLEQNEYGYIGEEITPSVSVYNGDELLTEDYDYRVEYSNNVYPGQATVKVIFYGFSQNEAVEHFTILPIKMRDCQVRISKTSYEYGNKSYTPGVSVTDSYGNSLSKNFYKVTYKNNKNVGKSSVTVTGNNEITGQKTLNFKIIPKISKKSSSIYVGQKYNVNAKSSTRITYKSSNSNVAKVNSKGIVSALRKGSVTITVKSNGQTNSMKISVKQPYVKIAKTKTVSLNGSTKISVKRLPGNARVTWSSSNKKIATVNGAGVVRGKKSGKATITAKIRYAGKTYTAKCKVTVKVVIKMSSSSITLHNSYYQKLKVYGGSGKITWKSSNKNVATVNSSGKVVGYGAGTSYIYAYRNGKRVSCKVTVSAAYAEDSYIPDFGAMYGIHRDNSAKVNGAVGYNVTNYSSDTVADMLSNYCRRLINWGFSYYGQETTYDSYRQSYVMYDPVKAVVVSYSITSNGNSYVIIAYGD